MKSGPICYVGGRHQGIAVLLGLLSLAGCARPDEARSPDVVWTVDSVPTVTLGSVFEESDLLFRVTGTVKLRTTYLVANAGNSEIRRYDLGGTPRDIIGRAGSGPGEFRSIRILNYTVADSVPVFDAGNRRLSIICDAVAICGEQSVPGVVQPFGMIGNVIYFKEIHPTLLVDQVGNDELLYLATRWDRQAPFDTLFRHEGPPRFARQTPRGMLGMPVPFSQPTSEGLVGDRIVISDGRSAALAVYDLAGNKLEEIAIPVDPEPVTSAEHRSFVEEAIRRMPEDRHALMRRFYDAMPVPERRSPIRRVIVDKQGLIWVEVAQNGPAHEWIVMDLNGRQHARVETPPGLNVMEIGEQYVLGVWRDSSEVEFVREYRLNRENE